MEEGEELGGYRLIRRLGTGGAGTVWLAEDGGGARVALKAMHPALAASEASRARLARETRTVNSVRSPFVAHIVDVETEASQPFVVSEYVEGPTLAEILVSGPVPLRGVAAMSYHLASTIAAVHHADIIHRDIKPSNIICSPRGPVLIDFGIAMATSDQHLTRTGLVSGTAGYTAPELLRGRGATKESDWWAWCATLLSCATGRPPFGAGDMSATMLRVIEAAPDLAGLHPLVADALAGGLASNPDDRPSPSLVVADLMGAVGWAPGELDYVTVNWAQLLDTGVPTQFINSDPQEIAAPPEWDDDGQRPVADGARAVSCPDRVPRDASEFAAEGDRTDVVDTAAIADSSDDWDEDTEEVPWHVDPTATWPVVDDAEPTEVMAPYAQGDDPGQQAPYIPGPGVSPGYGQVPYAPGPGVPPGQQAPYVPGPGVPPGYGGQAPFAPGPGMAPGYGQAYPQQPAVAPLAGGGPQWAPAGSFPQGNGQGRNAAASSWGRGAWISGASLLAALASLPFLLGARGTLVVGIALTAFGLVGAMSRWLERRRFLRGPKPSDGAAVLAMSPILLLRSVLTTSLALIVGGLIPYGLWAFASYSREGRVLWSWPVGVAIAAYPERDDYWLSDPTAAIIVWALAAATILAAWLMPFAADLRVGIATSLRSIVRPPWGRALLAVGCAGFLVGAWLIATGGLLH
ncbi:protein kinase [Schaalia meyeri]|uniref:Protein kinase n=1 Tax=Schaalia meyeri TaxID=52773 RepID=A0AAQ0BVJ1_9ACTO|nr:serine/threonine-protein kinase [Schaalia meyeri]QQC43419.1 protein kinase [Schaalia meyeri]SDR91040.1 Serine/threonine protein kinase [Schaalia meyeri]